MSSPNIVNLCLGLFLLSVVEALHGGYEIRGKQIECLYPKLSYIENATCTTRFLNRTSQIHNLTVFLKPEVNIDWMHFKINTFYKFNTVYRQLVVSSEFDVCGIFSGRKKSVLFDGEIDADANNFDKGCPYKDMIFIKNFIFHTEALALLLPIAPVGQWRLHIDVYSKRSLDKPEELILALRWFADIRLASNRSPSLNKSKKH